MNDARKKALHAKFEQFYTTGKVKNKRHADAIAKNWTHYQDWKTTRPEFKRNNFK